MRFTNTITIERPTSEVFAHLADLENLPRWNYAITETRKITARPVGVGTRYLQVRTVPKRSEETLEVIEFEPDRRLACVAHSAPIRAGHLRGRADRQRDQAHQRHAASAARGVCPGGTAGHPEGPCNGREESP